MLASPTTFVAEPVAPMVRRISGKTFWVVFVVEGLLIAGICAFVLSLLLPTHTPLADSGDVTRVREAVVARLGGGVADPLIELAPGSTARSSNLRGFTRNGVTYYYYLEGEQSFDPLSRGVVRADAVEVLLRDTTTPTPLVIYRYR